MTHLQTAGSMECPSCAASITFDRRFSPWCAECDWNVDAGRPKPAKLSRVERRRVALAARAAAGSAQAVAEHAPDRAPRWGVASTVGLVASGAVIGAWLLLVLAGVSMLGSGPIAVVIGLFILAIAAISRPRLGSKPEGAIARADAPELYALVDEIAATLKAPKVHVIAVDGDWNAATMRYGPLQRTVILFGLPLWHGLSDPGRLAVLGHEVGHSVNGDTSRGFLEGTALRTLETWSVITEPDEIVTAADDGLVAIASIPANLAMAALSWFFAFLFGALELVLLRPRRQAEFYADRLGAAVAGAPAMADALDRTRLHRAYERTVAAIAIASRPTDELFTDLRTQLASTPPSELERLRRQEARAPFDRDVLHPTTNERIAMLERRAAFGPPLLEIVPARMRAIDAELARVEPRVARELVEEYLAEIS
jgi:Zn-dependent protease with chaperone function